MKATDCKCIECGEPAVAFYPVIDPDITSNPYCKWCLYENKISTLLKISGMTDKQAMEGAKQRRNKAQQEQQTNKK